ncbi:hypothetical protein ACFPOU_17350 [Massilia jejuensis]|uniref:Uncharacterized protein n=1 Tax=Massilia jejuensis TaxID=648894 RepID=A0ABW0PJR6_9BURK
MIAMLPDAARWQNHAQRSLTGKVLDAALTPQRKYFQIPKVIEMSKNSIEQVYEFFKKIF